MGRDMTQPDSNSNQKDVFIALWFIAIPIIVAVALALFELIDVTDRVRIQGTWILVGICLGLIITILYRHYELFRTIGETRQAVNNAISSSDVVIRLNQRMAKIEYSLKTDDQFKRLCSLNDAMGEIASVRLDHSVLSDLIRWKEERIFSHWQRELANLSLGIIEIDDASKELNTNEFFLRTLPEHKVRAVSFQDEVFWNSNEGQSFLDAHSDVVRQKGIKIVRIFIIDDELTKYAVTFEQQQTHDVEVRYVRRTSVVDLSPEDFVIYDERAVRIGYPATGAEAADRVLINKYARLTTQRETVDSYDETFEALLKQSTLVPTREGAVSRA